MRQPLPPKACQSQERSLLIETHSHVRARDVTAIDPRETSIPKEAVLWRHTFNRPQGEVTPSSTPDQVFLLYGIDGNHPTWARGAFVSPLAFNCSAEAREELALTYGPGSRVRVSPPDPARAFSLYGTPGRMNRTWPAYGAIGGGWECLWPDAFTPEDQTDLSCGPLPSPLRMGGYAAGDLSLGRPGSHLARWVKAKGHTGNIPWRDRETRDEGELAVPDLNLRTMRKQDGPFDGDVVIRSDGQGMASASWSVGNWMWCVSVTEWADRRGYSFWGAAWADSGGYRYVIGPFQPFELRNSSEKAKSSTAFWWRFSTCVWTIRKLVASPDPGIRRFRLIT